MGLDWSNTANTLSRFGGEPITLTVRRTGMPFFDALQLYGAIDLYIGVRDGIEITDRGDQWQIKGHRRAHRLLGKDKLAFAAIWKKKKPSKDEYCQELSQALEGGAPVKNDQAFNELALGRLDRSLQAGIRGIAAADYGTLKSAQTSKKACIAEVPLSQAMLASVGRKRVLRLGEITFLPIFEGLIDLSKVVNPLRLSLTIPNVLCAQALAILALITSLFAEGYQGRLSSVAFETNFRGQRSDNYSGIVSIRSTAVGAASADFIDRLYDTFRTLVQSGWKRRGREYEATELATDALSAAQWLMQPVAKHLNAIVTSQEKMHRRGMGTFLRRPEDVQEVFNMSHPGWQGDYKALRKYARAVASGIYHARMKDAKDRGKAWYDEVTMLRSAAKPSSFFERAQILIEQGHREHGGVGTEQWGEAFEPSALMQSINADDFETFKVLFRMYLVQESTPRIARQVDTADSGPQGPGGR
ncbi:MAG: hypothetical protein IVW54_20280 [Candidatus Binataceae bacterium]|nr:hypothetical protein [Candidatus Binataceae bacterium]